MLECLLASVTSDLKYDPARTSNMARFSFESRDAPPPSEATLKLAYIIAFRII